MPNTRRLPTAVRLRHAILAMAIPGMAACAHLAPTGDARAIDEARRSVCGRGSDANDSSCTVSGHRRVPGGVQVVIARRPPAGRDLLLVTVRGGQIDVEPVRGEAR